MNPYLLNIKAPASILIADRVRDLELNGEKIAALQTGEPCFSTPAYICNGFNEAVNKGFTGYSSSQGLYELRKEIAKYYNRDSSNLIDIENIIISNGAVHAIYCLITAILSKGDEVIIPEPAWPQYKSITLMVGGNPVCISTLKNPLGKLSAADIRENITDRTKLIILNNPCNPTGVVYQKNEIISLLEIAKEKNVYVLFDEVYNELVFEEEDFISVTSPDIYNKYQENILYINSFSKKYAMTGWRVGYSIVPARLVNSVLLISQISITNVNTPAQYAAFVAIRDRKENQNIYDKMFNLYKSRWLEIASLLDKNKMQYISSQGAFYYFIKIEEDCISFSYNLLNKEKIAVVPGNSYGDKYTNFIRVSFSVDEFSYNHFKNWLGSN